MTLIEKMQTMEGFTSSEKTVVTYLLEQPHLVQNMSIRDLAAAAFTSNTTIIRICKKLGYDGFKDFKIAFLMEIELNKLIHKSIDFSQPFYQDESTTQIIHSMSSLYKETIDTISTLLNVKEIDHITDDLIKAKRIFVFAIGDSRLTAQSFVNKLMKINIYAILATENYQEVATAYNMTREDIALFVSYNGLVRNYITVGEFLYQRQIKMILLTGNEDSQLVKWATYPIVIPDRESIYKIGTFYSQISFDFILNIFYSKLYSYNYAYSHKHKAMIDAAEKSSRIKK